MSVPIATNPPERPSRLFTSIRNYLSHSGVTILRSIAMYRPLRVFSWISAVLLLTGLILGVRFLVYYFQGVGSGHIQSLILTAILLIIGFITFLIGLLADLVSFNRKILEEILYRLRQQDCEQAMRENGLSKPDD
jgi:hypothetical protein